MKYTALPGAFLPGLEDAIISTARRLLAPGGNQ
jgi:hypothetical protein